MVVAVAEPPQVLVLPPGPLLGFHPPQEMLPSYWFLLRLLAQQVDLLQAHLLALPQVAMLLPALDPMTFYIRKRPVLPTAM